MDTDTAITVTKLNIQDKPCYVLIAWQTKSFDMYLYRKDDLWKGKFSSNRLAGFSRNLHMSEDAYYQSMKQCLGQPRNDYCYELKSGFFYWKRRLKDSMVIEGFLPMVLDDPSNNTRPDLVEVLITLNRHLMGKLKDLKYKFKSVRIDYEKYLKDTEEFLNLKIDMEKALCDKFLNLLHMKKSNIDRNKNIDFELNKINHDT